MQCYSSWKIDSKKTRHAVWDEPNVFVFQIFNILRSNFLSFFCVKKRAKNWAQFNTIQNQENHEQAQREKTRLGQSNGCCYVSSTGDDNWFLFHCVNARSFTTDDNVSSISFFLHCADLQWQIILAIPFTKWKNFNFMLIQRKMNCKWNVINVVAVK